MIFLRKKRVGGFTLVEIMVAISIIAILSGLIFSVLINTRKEARDRLRTSVAEQMKISFRLYKEAVGKYPLYPDGVELGVGNPIDTDLGEYIQSIKKDPSAGAGAGDDAYAYWYDSDFDCTAGGQTVLFVRTMEDLKNANLKSVCTYTDAHTVANDHSYIVMINGASTHAIVTPPPADDGSGDDGGNGSGGNGSGSNPPPPPPPPQTNRACTAATNGGAWATDWDPQPRAHNSVWRTNFFGIFGQRCCNGHVYVAGNWGTPPACSP